MKSRVDNKKNEKRKLRKTRRQQKKERRIERFRKNRKIILIALFILIILFIFYTTLLEVNMLKINEYKIESEEISSSFDGVKIVHFSDLHFGTSINASNIHKVITKINYLKPDIVVFTGDLIDSKKTLSNKEIKNITKILKSIEAKLGKYAIIGNHDYYNKDYENIMYDSDFIILKNSYEKIYYKDNSPLLIYGVDDFLYGNPLFDSTNIQNFDNIKYKILLTHEGDYIKKIDTSIFDLILAGHSHNGQVNLFGLEEAFLPVGSKVYHKPYTKLGSSNIFVSNGIGTTRIKMRFRSIPSINLYRINKK